MNEYDINDVNNFLKETDKLKTYCRYLAEKFRQTNEGKYRIKFNDLNALLHSPLSEEKKVEFFNSFATSLGIYPISSLENVQFIMI